MPFSLTAIFFCTTVVGPGVGFGVGFLVLGLYVDFNAVAPEDVLLTSSDPSWVGAWWLGFFICASMIAIPAIPVYAFPARLPTYSEDKMVAEADDENSTTNSSGDEQLLMSFNLVSLKSKHQTFLKSVQPRISENMEILLLCTTSFNMSNNQVSFKHFELWLG